MDPEIHNNLIDGVREEISDEEGEEVSNKLNPICSYQIGALSSIVFYNEHE